MTERRPTEQPTAGQTTTGQPATEEPTVAPDADSTRRSPRRRWWGTGVAVLVVAALTLVLGRGLASAGTDDPSTALAGHVAPPLAGRTLDGGHADLADLRGHVVLVTVWASWCAPCRDELPVLAAAKQAWHDRGLRVLGVSTRDTAASAKELLKQTHASDLTSVVDPDGTIAVTWGTRGVPETFVVGPDGVVRDRCIGALTPQWLADHVKPLLA
jgi:cytochrome c biogenesis protein CcmG/thiol:disulfide interchange protein DsbE